MTRKGALLILVLVFTLSSAFTAFADSVPNIWWCNPSTGVCEWID